MTAIQTANPNANNKHTIMNNDNNNNTNHQQTQ